MAFSASCFILAKRMKYLFTLLILFFANAAFGQKELQGVVVSAENNMPVPAASIFLNNTSVGTTAGSNGSFTLWVPAGRYDLVVSSVGYETYTQNITAATLPDQLTIRLQPKAKELETVIVEPFEKDGWQKWGKFFLDNFIGMSDNAQNCVIKNSGAIKFRHSKKDNKLTAVAMEPLQIENKALGYTVTYQLEGFTYDFNTKYLIYQGYPFFQPMKGGAARQRQWAARRQQVYEGSMMHFMRSLYRNTLTEEGFQVRRLQKIPNWEKQRVKAQRAKYTIRQTSANGQVTISDTTPPDSSGYYNRILAQEDYFDKIGRELLTGDSIAYAVNTTTAGLGFPDYLLVIYNKKTAPAAYVQQFPKSGTAMASQLTLMNNTDIQVQSNGSYYNPVDLLSMGYWAWSEKIATMLPFDYLPPQKEK